MADQKKWFKVWTSILDDPHFQELTLEEIGAWALLGAMTAKVGNRGVLAVPGSGRRLREALRVVDMEAAKRLIEHLPSVHFGQAKHASGEHAVTWNNWRRYQEDSGVAERVTRLRSKRREEKIRAEKNSDDAIGLARTRPAAQPPDPLFSRFWAEYPRHIDKPRALKAWRSMHVNNGEVDALMTGLENWRAYWTRQQTPTDRIPYPATWLTGRRWEDDLSRPTANPYADFPTEAP